MGWLSLTYEGPMPARPRDWLAWPRAWSLNYVYIFRDSDGDVLYVGMTHNPPGRWTAHKRKKPWWGDISTVELWAVRGADRWEAERRAREVERRCIRALDPIHNIVGRVA